MTGLHRRLSNINDANEYGKSRFLALNSKLKNFKDHQKKTEKESSQVIHWLKEYTSLRNEQMKIEKGLVSLLESLTKYEREHQNTKLRSDNDLISLIHANHTINAKVQDEQNYLSAQISNLKNIMSEVCFINSIGDSVILENKKRGVAQLADFFLKQKEFLLDLECDLESSIKNTSSSIKCLEEILFQEYTRTNGKYCDVLSTSMSREVHEKLKLCQMQLKCFQETFEDDLMQLKFDSLYNDIVHEFFEIDEVYNSLLHEAQEQLLAITPDALKPNGGWSDDEYFIMRNAIGANGKINEVALHQSKTVANATLFITWYNQKKIFLQKVKAAKCNRNQKKAELSVNVHKKVDDFMKIISTHKVNKASKSVQESQRYEIQHHLMALREARNEKDTQEMVEKQRVNLLEHESDRVARDQRDKRLERIKLSIKRHNEIKQIQREQNEEVLSRQRSVEAEEKAARVKYNSKRVFHRRQLLCFKHEAQVASKASYAELEKNRIEKLHRLASHVPYYHSISNVKPVFQTKSTTARDNDKFVPDHTGLKSFQNGAYGKATSFSDKRVFSSKLFRLSNALHEAGLAKSNYAKEVVKQLVPRGPARTTGIVPS